MKAKVAIAVFFISSLFGCVRGFLANFRIFSFAKGITSKPTTSLFAHHVNKKITKRMMDRRPKKSRPSDITRNNKNHGICITKMGLPPDYTIIPAAEFDLHYREDMFKWQDGDPEVEWIDVPAFDPTKAAINPCQEPPPKNVCKSPPILKNGWGRG